MNLSYLAVTAIAVLVGLSVILAIAWQFWRKTGNAGWIDATWSFGVGMVAACAALFPFDGRLQWRQWTMALIAALWGLRLGLHIVWRTQGAPNDPRYCDLAERWGASAVRRMFWFLQSQAFVGALLSSSIALAAHNSSPHWRIQDLMACLLFILALAGEASADLQLRRFKEKSSGQGGICDQGLWAWSRHPNYFFEWLFWLAVAFVAVDLDGHNPYGWLALVAPITMYWVLVHVSGIPPLEAHMLRSRGDTFRDYKRRTSRFFPLPPGLNLALAQRLGRSRVRGQTGED